MMLFGVVLVILGIQFLSMGFLGELIAKERGSRALPDSRAARRMTRRLSRSTLASPRVAPDRGPLEPEAGSDRSLPRVVARRGELSRRRPVADRQRLARSSRPGARRPGFPSVNLLRLETNRLTTRPGRQPAASSGRWAGDYAHAILFNNDTEAAPDLVGAPGRSGGGPTLGLGSWGPKIYYASIKTRRDLIWSAGGEIHLVLRHVAYRGLRQPDGPIWDEPRDVDYLTGACLLITRPALAKVGPPRRGVRHVRRGRRLLSPGARARLPGGLCAARPSLARSLRPPPAAG